MPQKNTKLIEELYERANDIQWEMIEAGGANWDNLNNELTEINERLAELDISLEELEMQREGGYV